VLGMEGELGRNTIQPLGDLLHVRAALLVVVRHDRHMPPLQRSRVFVSPLSCSLGVGGRHQSQFREQIDILFALGQVDRFITIGSQKLGESLLSLWRYSGGTLRVT
jgi:hypothetical protein